MHIGRTIPLSEKLDLASSGFEVVDLEKRKSNANYHTCRLTLIVVTHAVIELLEDVQRAPGSDSLPGAHELFG